MSVWDNMCGKIENKENPSVKPEKFFYLNVKEFHDDTDNTPRFNVTIMGEKFVDYTSNILDILNKFEVEQCKTASKFIKFQNVIAVDTKRGVGNTLICSQSFKDKLDIKAAEAGVPDVDWLLHIKQIITNELPDNEAVLSYTGTSYTDAGIFRFTDAEGNTFYKEHPEAKKYIHRLKI